MSYIRFRSKRKEGQWREYVKKRNRYLEEHVKCECCNNRSSTELHHRRGRGLYLCIEKYFMAVCLQCHQLIERERKWAYDMGYLIDRIGHD